MCLECAMCTAACCTSAFEWDRMFTDCASLRNDQLICCTRISFCKVTYTKNSMQNSCLKCYFRIVTFSSMLLCWCWPFAVQYCFKMSDRINDLSFWLYNVCKSVAELCTVFNGLSVLWSDGVNNLCKKMIQIKSNQIKYIS